MRLPASIRSALLALASVLLASAAAHAALPEGVTETSYVLSSGERVLELAHDVWGAWATSAGYQSWAAPVAYVDFRVGGAIETSYNPKAVVGAKTNIRNLILAIVPERAFLIRNLQAPGKTPFDAPTFQKTQTAVVLTPLDEQRTRVTLINSGYAAGALWDGVYDFFRTGNAWSLTSLRDRFAKGPTDWSKSQVPGGDVR
jgi:hypothetical protein